VHDFSVVHDFLARMFSLRMIVSEYRQQPSQTVRQSVMTSS
jgi:hypothetical protein